MFIVYIQIAIVYKFPVLATQLTAGHIELSFYGPNICWRKKIGNSKKNKQNLPSEKKTEEIYQPVLSIKNTKPCRSEMNQPGISRRGRYDQNI